MKKTYFAPTTTVVGINGRLHLMAGSPNLSGEEASTTTGEDGSDEYNTLSRRNYDLWADDEDEASDY